MQTQGAGQDPQDLLSADSRADQAADGRKGPAGHGFPAAAAAQAQHADDDPADEDEEDGDEDEDDEQTDDEYDDDPADEDELDHRSRLLLNEDYHCEQKKVKEQSFQDFLAILHTADTLIRSGICEFSDFARLMVNFHGVRSTLYIKNAYRCIMALPGYDDQKLCASSPEDVDDFDLEKLQPSLCEILI